MKTRITFTFKSMHSFGMETWIRSITECKYMYLCGQCQVGPVVLCDLLHDVHQQISRKCSWTFHRCLQLFAGDAPRQQWASHQMSLLQHVAVVWWDPQWPLATINLSKYKVNGSHTWSLPVLSELVFSKSVKQLFFWNLKPLKVLANTQTFDIASLQTCSKAFRHQEKILSAVFAWWKKLSRNRDFHSFWQGTRI